jgi:hypothetical protein
MTKINIEIFDEENKIIINLYENNKLIREFDNFKSIREFLQKPNLIQYYDSNLIHDSEYDVSPEVLNKLEGKIKVIVDELLEKSDIEKDVRKPEIEWREKIRIIKIIIDSLNESMHYYNAMMYDK